MQHILFLRYHKHINTLLQLVSLTELLLLMHRFIIYQHFRFYLKLSYLNPSSMPSVVQSKQWIKVKSRTLGFFF